MCGRRGVNLVAGQVHDGILPVELSVVALGQPHSPPVLCSRILALVPDEPGSMATPLQPAPASLQVLEVMQSALCTANHCMLAWCSRSSTRCSQKCGTGSLEGCLQTDTQLRRVGCSTDAQGHLPVCVLQDVKVSLLCLFPGWWRHLAAIKVYILAHHELVPLVGCHAQHLLPSCHSHLSSRYLRIKVLLAMNPLARCKALFSGVLGGRS